MIDILKAEFQRRKRDNKRYSLRAFATFLGIPAGRLSEILSGKRKISSGLREKISTKLGIEQVQDLIATDSFRSLNFSERQDYAPLASEVFDVVADWYHFAILSLMDTQDFVSDIEWIGSRLGINKELAESAIDKMVRVGVLKIEKNKLVKTDKNIFTTNDIPSEALRSSHKQSIAKALLSLDEVSIDLRAITSMTMAIDLKKLALAKSLIREFSIRMSDLLESGNQTEVYDLNIQLSPVTVLGKSPNKTTISDQ